MPKKKPIKRIEMDRVGKSAELLERVKGLEAEEKKRNPDYKIPDVRPNPDYK